MFDCVIVDFKNRKSSLKYLQQKFPFAIVVPFVDSYHLIAKKVCSQVKTERFWLLSTKIDYSNFDFDFIPEQHESYQLHTWALDGQKEGDTFLIPRDFPMFMKYMRDFVDINYHTHDAGYDYDYDFVEYDLSNSIENLPKQLQNRSKYVVYYEDPKQMLPPVYISYWEDLKIYKHESTYFIPYEALSVIKTQLYDYPYINTIAERQKQDCFDIVFISNGEPFAKSNYDRLAAHCKAKNISNKLIWVDGVDGRTRAYKEAASRSNTEYFYAVFAKSVVKDDFRFDYNVDRAVSKRHRIFYSYLPEVDVAYGTFNINLYNKTLCLGTPDDKILDFTLSSAHEIVPIVASESMLAPDNYTAWKNGFREVSKLVLWQNEKPSVETKYRLKKWFDTEHEWLKKGASDGKAFTEECEFDKEKILQTYTWDFCRARFRSLYPMESFY